MPRYVAIDTVKVFIEPSAEAKPTYSLYTAVTAVTWSVEIKSDRIKPYNDVTTRRGWGCHLSE